LKLNKKFIVLFLALIVLVLIFVPKLNQKIKINYSWLNDYEGEIDSLGYWGKPIIIGESLETGLIAEYLAESPNMKICVRYGIRQSEILELAVLFLGDTHTESFVARFQNLIFESGDKGSNVVFNWMYERGFFDKPGLPMRVKEVLNSLKWGGE